MTAKDVEPVLPASQSKKAPESFPGALPFKSTIQSTISNGPGGTQPVRGSSVVGCGGGKRVRTADLLHAMQALYQLSYTPNAARLSQIMWGIVNDFDGKSGCKKMSINHKIFRL